MTAREAIEDDWFADKDLWEDLEAVETIAGHRYLRNAAQYRFFARRSWRQKPTLTANKKRRE